MQGSYHSLFKIHSTGKLEPAIGFIYSRLFLSFSVIQHTCKFHSDHLEDLEQDDQQCDRDQHDIRLPVILGVGSTLREDIDSWLIHAGLVHKALVEVLHDEQQTATISAILFGRETPTDVGYGDLEKID